MAAMLLVFVDVRHPRKCAHCKATFTAYNQQDVTWPPFTRNKVPVMCGPVVNGAVAFVDYPVL